jgi:hypothetical protein
MTSLDRADDADERFLFRTGRRKQLLPFLSRILKKFIKRYFDRQHCQHEMRTFRSLLSSLWGRVIKEVSRFVRAFAFGEGVNARNNVTDDLIYVVRIEETLAKTRIINSPSIA